MGSIALLRQAFYDAQWCMQTVVLTKKKKLSAMRKTNKLQKFFNQQMFNRLRANKIADEFNATFVIKESGDESTCK